MFYRPDIDGLRAIAVLSVVIFHLGVPGFDGGFIGVDVFFVISGYLITSNIMKRHEAGSFSLAEFYFRRIRRLLPALVATVAATFAGAAMLMTPYDMVSFGRSAIAAMFSLSNVVFYLEAGYWDTASELKPLLHTWSLGVEEQFYLFWPALMLLLLHGGRRWLVAGLLLLALVGTLVTVWYSGVDQSAAFYLLPFRVFQFAAGALVIICAGRLATRQIPRWCCRALVLAGLLLIGVGVHLIDESVEFPGWVIIVPTVAAFLMLLGGALAASSKAGQPWLLSNPLMTWLGRVSYSMYLVHWPIVALFRYEYGLEIQFSDQLVLALVTLAGTVLLHYGVEKQFYARDSGNTADGRFAGLTLVTAMLLSVAPLTAWQGDGWAWRFASLTLTPEQIEEGMKDRYRFLHGSCFITYSIDHEACRYDTGPQVLIIGDSYEPDALNFMRGAYEDANNLVLFGTVNKCDGFLKTPWGGFTSSDTDCQARMDALLDPGKLARFDVLLYTSNRPFDPNPSQLMAIELIHEIKRRRPALPVLTLGGYVNTRLHCSRHINETGSVDSCALPQYVNYFENAPETRLNYAVVHAFTDYYVDRVEMLCKNRVLQTCLMRADDGTPAFYDRLHHSRQFAEMAGRMYVERRGDFIGALIKAP